MSFQSEIYKSAFSVDNIIFGFDDDKLKVLLIKRKDDPFAGQWALPGDIVRPEENLDHAAGRVLQQLTGLTKVYLDQVHTFGEVDRHPKGRVITIAYYSLIKIAEGRIKAASFAEDVQWKEVRAIMSLAFDHHHIMQTCLDRLKQDIKLRPIGFELLPEKFTLTELQRLYEVILEQPLDKRNFRKKIMNMRILNGLNEYQSGVSHRPAMLYEFDKDKYDEAIRNGVIFEI